MATVPGSPSSNVTPMLPPWARPTPADFLQAAAIMQEKQQQLAMSLPPQRHLQLYTQGKIYGDVTTHDELKLQEEEMEGHSDEPILKSQELKKELKELKKRLDESDFNLRRALGDKAKGIPSSAGEGT
jgi:hypothetical protein